MIFFAIVALFVTIVTVWREHRSYSEVTLRTRLHTKYLFYLKNSEINDLTSDKQKNSLIFHGSESLMIKMLEVMYMKHTTGNKL